MGPEPGHVCTWDGARAVASVSRHCTAQWLPLLRYLCAPCWMLFWNVAGVKCGGQITIGLVSAGTVNVDFVFVQPGKWARLGDLPVLKETVTWMQNMGVTAIR